MRLVVVCRHVLGRHLRCRTAAGAGGGHSAGEANAPSAFDVRHVRRDVRLTVRQLRQMGTCCASTCESKMVIRTTRRRICPSFRDSL